MIETSYITTPIYYANSSPHLGHLYTTVVADAVARYKRQRGVDTYFLTGTDEHGINIERAAERNGRTPKEQVDAVSGEIKQLFNDFRLDTENGGYDIFMRTTEPFHYKGAQELWRAIAKSTSPKGNSNIYKGHYEGWFCAPCASFKTEDEYYIPEGSDVPNCLVHERPLDRVSEESYFFRLSDYSEFLLETIDARPDLIRPEARRNEVVSFIKQGLQDLSISRERTSVSWGIPVPDDEDHVMYVWLDALSNYITALGYGNEREGSAGFDKYWQNVVHLVGKDILRFHAIYWPAFLFAAGLELPKTIFAHGLWLDADGRKMSKTLGNVIDVNVLREHFQIDAVRYFLLREMVFGQDGKFGYENLIDRVNADLAGGLGNLSSRTLSMVAKYRDGVVPSGAMNAESRVLAEAAGLAPDEDDLIAVLAGLRDDYLKRFERFEFNNALESAWAVIAAADKMISDSKPWLLAKDETNAEVLNAVLYRSLESLRWLCVLLYPVMPEATRNIYRQLGFDGDVAAVDPASLEWGGTAAGTKIGETSGVFPRIDKTKVMNEIENSGQETVVDGQSTGGQKSEPPASAGGQKSEPPASTGGQKSEPPALAGGQSSDQPTPEESFITIDDFLKVDLRVGVVQVCERIPKADKLLRFEIDLGEEKPRQILAGLAEYYEPEAMIGRKVVVVANLKPRKMRGLESQGMICAASLEDGTGPKPAVATFLEDVEIGARLK